MDARNADFEAAIVRDPDDLAAYAVYGDWLAEQGDPRGELIATQLAAEASGDPELRRAALRVFAKHREAFIGDLGSMIATDAFTWRAGFIQRAALSHDRLLIEGGSRVAASLADVVGALLAHPSARFLTDLAIRTNDRDAWGRSLGSQKDAVDRIVAARPVVLRRLQLGDVAYGIAQVGRLEHAWPALANLHALVVEGEFSLGRVVLPELRSLALHPIPLRRRGGRELVEAVWPKLRSLQLHLGNAPFHVARDITQLIHRTDLPELAHLGLLAYSSAQKFLDELARSPLLARLQSLDLRHGNLRDHSLRPMLANPGAFAHLTRIDLSQTAITTTALARVRQILPNVAGDDLIDT